MLFHKYRDLKWCGSELTILQLKKTLKNLKIMKNEQDMVYLHGFRFDKDYVNRNKLLTANWLKQFVIFHPWQVSSNRIAFHLNSFINDTHMKILALYWIQYKYSNTRLAASDVFVCLQNQLSSFNSIIVQVCEKRDSSNRQ